MPELAQPKHAQYNFVYEAVLQGEFELLKSMCPGDFDFASLLPEGISWHHVFLSKSVLAQGESSQRYRDMAEWLIRSGADPSVKAADDADSGKTIFLHSDPEKNRVTVTYAGKSAITVLLEFQRDFRAKHNAINGPNWQSFLDNIEMMLKLYIKCADIKCADVRQAKSTTSISIDESVVDLWDHFRQNDESRDVKIVDSNKQTALAHSGFLAAASPVLKAMLMGGFNEGNEKNITVDEKLHEGTLDLLLELLYCGSADEKGHKWGAVLDALSLSHRWQLTHVLNICSRRLVDMFTCENIESIAEVFFRDKL